MHTWWTGHLRWVPLYACVVAVASCSHGEPFAPADTSSDTPFEPGIQPVRLTYGGGRTPAWMPDGERIIYSYPSAEHGNHGTTPDLCLGILPASGGRRIASYCNRSPFEADSLDVLAEPVPGPDGSRIGFLHAQRDPVSGLGISQLVVGTLDALPVGDVWTNTSFTGAHGQILGLGVLRWLNSGELIALGADDGISAPCSACDPVVIRRWREAYRVPDGGGPPTLIPGTEYATSLGTGAAADLYLTFANDQRVVHLDVASGATSVVATLGADRTPRDADYSGGRIALAAGGELTQLVDEMGDPAQGNDFGGELTIVETGTGTVIPIPNDHLLFRHPRWSPDGRALVAEGYAYQVITIIPDEPGPTYIDTTVAAVPDIYRFDFP